MSVLHKLRGFLSWIVFALFPNSMVAWAAFAGLAVSLVLFVQDRRRGIKLDALVLDVAALFFFATLSVAALADPRAPLGAWSSALSFGWLALVAWASISIGQPFTLGMARRRVGRDIWTQPAFKRSQTALTRMWAPNFTLITLALAVCDHPPQHHPHPRHPRRRTGYRRAPDRPAHQGVSAARRRGRVSAVKSSPAQQAGERSWRAVGSPW